MRGLFITTDLMFLSRVALVARENQWELLTVSSAGELLARASEQAAALVLIDLTTRELGLPSVLDQLRSLETPPAAYVAFGPHVQKGRLDAARSAGCDQVLTRGQFDANMRDVLARYLGSFDE